MSYRKASAMRGPLALIALAALAATAAASALDTADGMTAGRDLLQTAADCARSVPYCNTCESFMGGQGGMTAAACRARQWAHASVGDSL